MKRMGEQSINSLEGEGETKIEEITRLESELRGLDEELKLLQGGAGKGEGGLSQEERATAKRKRKEINRKKENLKEELEKLRRKGVGAGTEENTDSNLETDIVDDKVIEVKVGGTEEVSDEEPTTEEHKEQAQKDIPNFGALQDNLEPKIEKESEKLEMTEKERDDLIKNLEGVTTYCERLKNRMNGRGESSTQLDIIQSIQSLIESIMEDEKTTIEEIEKVIDGSDMADRKDKFIDLINIVVDDGDSDEINDSSIKLSGGNEAETSSEQVIVGSGSDESPSTDEEPKPKKELEKLEMTEEERKNLIKNLEGMAEVYKSGKLEITEKLGDLIKIVLGDKETKDIKSIIDDSNMKDDVKKLVKEAIDKYEYISRLSVFESKPETGLMTTEADFESEEELVRAMEKIEELEETKERLERGLVYLEGEEIQDEDENKNKIETIKNEIEKCKNEMNDLKGRVTSSKVKIKKTTKERVAEPKKDEILTITLQEKIDQMDTEKLNAEIDRIKELEEKAAGHGVDFEEITGEDEESIENYLKNLESAKKRLEVLDEELTTKPTIGEYREQDIEITGTEDPEKTTEEEIEEQIKGIPNAGAVRDRKTKTAETKASPEATAERKEIPENLKETIEKLEWLENYAHKVISEIPEEDRELAEKWKSGDLSLSPEETKIAKEVDTMERSRTTAQLDRMTVAVTASHYVSHEKAVELLGEVNYSLDNILKGLDVELKKAELALKMKELNAGEAEASGGFGEASKGKIGKRVDETLEDETPARTMGELAKVAEGMEAPGNKLRRKTRKFLEKFRKCLNEAGEKGDEHTLEELEKLRKGLNKKGMFNKSETDPGKVKNTETLLGLLDEAKETIEDGPQESGDTPDVSGDNHESKSSKVEKWVEENKKDLEEKIESINFENVEGLVKVADSLAEKMGDDKKYKDAKKLMLTDENFGIKWYEVVLKEEYKDKDEHNGAICKNLEKDRKVLENFDDGALKDIIGKLFDRIDELRKEKFEGERKDGEGNDKEDKLNPDIEKAEKIVADFVRDAGIKKDQLGGMLAVIQRVKIDKNKLFGDLIKKIDNPLVNEFFEKYDEKLAGLKKMTVEEVFAGMDRFVNGEKSAEELY